MRPSFEELKFSSILRRQTKLKVCHHYTLFTYIHPTILTMYEICVCVRSRALLAKSTCKWHTNKTTWILNPNEWQWLLCSTNSSVHPLLVAPANIWTVNTHFSTWLKFELMSFLDKFPYKWSLFQVFIRFLLFKVFEILPHVYVRVHRTWLSNSVT